MRREDVGVFVLPGNAEHRTSDAQLRVGKLEIPGSALRAARNDSVDHGRRRPLPTVPLRKT
jgi:hypothetical protein